MKFSTSFFLSLSCLTLWSANISAEDTKPWAHEASDIAPDANVTYGSLPNGMRYILMPNQQPPGRVSMRLHIDAGSLMERDDQRGVAHFLEHMVFNGSKNFPDASKLIPKMQRLGISFGAHANAYTSFDETVYMLDLPNNEADTLKLGFDVMRDFGDGAFLREEEIEKERGVILSEKTSRDSVQFRLMEKQFKELLPEALIANRFPIGTEEVIKTAPRSAFIDFYSEYYIPSRMTFVYVGDFDVAAAEQRIIDTFSSMENPEKKGADPDLGKVTTKQGFHTLLLTDKEVDTTDITLLALKPFEQKPDTKENRALDLPLNIANAMINSRLSLLSKEENAPFASGYTFNQNLFKFMKMGGITINAKNHNWKAAVPVLANELRRAITHGFNTNEFKEVQANLVNQYEQAIKSASSRKTNDLASSLTKHIHKNAVFSSTEDDLAIFKENIEAISAVDCHDALKEFWNTEDATLILTSNKSGKHDAASLMKIYKESQVAILKKPAERKPEKFAYTDFSTLPLKAIEVQEDDEEIEALEEVETPQAENLVGIKAQNHIKDLDISQMEFHNGCKCNVKKTDFDKNSIIIVARIGGGKLTMPKSQKGLDLLTSTVINEGGLGEHSKESLNRLLAGRNVGVKFSVANDAFTLSAKTTPEDLELQLQLLCAYIADPGLRPEAERVFDAQIPSIYSQIKHTSAGPQSRIDSYLRGFDARFTMPKEDALKALSTEHVKKWIIPAFDNDYLELSIIGDIDESALTPILNKTVALLPARSATKPDYKEERAVNKQPSTNMYQRYTFDSKIPTGSAMVVWKTTGLKSDNIGTARRLGVLSTILSNRMREKIREELGEAYSPYAQSRPDDVFTDVGFMVAVSPGTPEQAKPIGELIIKIADELSKEGATEDELERAVAPILSSIEQSVLQNSYWLNTVMAKSQEQPYRLDWARSRSEDYANVKLEEINELAKKYLDQSNTYRFEIVPVDRSK